MLYVLCSLWLNRASGHVVLVIYTHTTHKKCTRVGHSKKSLASTKIDEPHIYTARRCWLWLSYYSIVTDQSIFLCNMQHKNVHSWVHNPITKCKHWVYGKWKYKVLNMLRPRQNGHHFADDTFKHIFLNENVKISIKISLKFVPKGPINNIPALVQIVAWRRPGDKPLSEPMMVKLPTHICVSRPQWVEFTQKLFELFGMWKLKKTN